MAYVTGSDSDSGSGPARPGPGTADRTRRYVLAGIVAVLGVITGAILLDVLGTILFAITVAYVLAPVHRWLCRRGLSEWTAGVIATLLGFVSVVAIFAPIAVTLYVRIDEIVATVRALPDAFSVTVLETTLTIQAVEVQSLAISYLQGFAATLATSAPVLAVKFALFVLLLFGLLLRGEEAATAALAPVPRAYRDVALALADRARETLYAIYVLQVATAVVTFVVAYPFFWMVGYDAPFLLAIVAAILQFVPMIGPSLLLAPIAVYHLAVGDLTTAALVGGLGMALIAWMPDVTVRPRLAERSGGLSGSLYFVGFTGGLFTLGMIGIIVGPLVVAVFVEAVELLAAEVNADGERSVGASAATDEAGPEPDEPAVDGREGSLESPMIGDSSLEPDSGPDPDFDADADSGSDSGSHSGPDRELDPRTRDDSSPST